MMMLRFTLACLLIAVFGLSSSSAQSVPHSFRISCGSLKDVKSPPTYTLWHKDTAFTGGMSANATAPSDITPSLKTLRYFPLSDGPTNCYNIVRVPPGHYSIRVFFGLLSFETEPLFDISIQGTKVSSLTPGWSKHDEQVFAEALLFLENGTATICFHNNGHGDPAIISLEIQQIEDSAYGFSKELILKTVTRLNCGSKKPKFDEDYDGDIWGGNRFWSPAISFANSAGSRLSVDNDIINASSPPNLYPQQIYQSALVSGKSDIFDLKPNQEYSVWLHFAEIDPSVNRVGDRVFDIILNGVTVFKDVDIVNISGGKYAAIVLNSTVVVTGRSLNIVLHPKVGSHAIVNAIEVFEVITKTSRGGVIPSEQGPAPSPPVHKNEEDHPSPMIIATLASLVMFAIVCGTIWWRKHRSATVAPYARFQWSL